MEDNILHEVHPNSKNDKDRDAKCSKINTNHLAKIFDGIMETFQKKFLQCQEPESQNGESEDDEEILRSLQNEFTFINDSQVPELGLKKSLSQKESGMEMSLSTP